MKFLRKHYGKISLTVITLLILAIPASIIWAADQITSPPRRALMDYHHEYLTAPADHGIVIEKFTAPGRTPALFVTPAPSGNLGDRGRKIRDQLTAAGIRLKPPGQITGTLVLLHGRRGRKEDFLPIAERLCASGFRCIIPDLPAHGENPAPFTTYGIREASIPSDLLDHASRKFGFSPQPAGILGMSMGGSVANHATSLPDSPWKAAVILCSFDSLRPVVEEQAALRMGGSLAAIWTDAVDNLCLRKTGVALSAIHPKSAAATCRIPVLVAHGTEDRDVSFAAGKRLYESFANTQETKWVEIPRAGHDNLLVTDFPIYSEIAAWFIRHLKGTD